MPCYDGSDNERIVYQESGIQTSRLCAVFSVLERNGQLENILSQCDWKESGVSRKSTLEWWERHKQEDHDRQARERLTLQRKREKEAVLSKLSLKERKLLGL